MAVAQASANSYASILSALAMANASKTFSPFSTASAKDSPSLRGNIAAQQSSGLLQVSIEQSLSETEDLKRTLEDSKALMYELDLLGLRIENRPNIEMLEVQTTQLQQQSKSHIGNLESTQHKLDNILQQTAQASAKFSTDMNKILRSHDANNIDDDRANQFAYKLYVNQTKNAGQEKKIIKEIVNAVPEKERKAVENEIRPESDEYAKTLNELQKQQNEITTSIKSAEISVKETQENIGELQTHKRSVAAFNKTAEKTIKIAHEQHGAETTYPAPPQAGDV